MSFLGLPQHVTINLVVENHRNVFAASSGGQKSEVKVSAGLASSGGSEGEPVPCLPPSFRWTHSLTCGNLTPVSASVFTWVLPCLLLCACGCQISLSFLLISMTLVIGFRVHPTSRVISSGGPYLRLQRLLFPGKVIFTGARG